MAHFDAYLRYSDELILSSAVPAGRGVPVPPARKFLIITNKLIIIMTTWKDCSITSNTSK